MVRSPYYHKFAFHIKISLKIKYDPCVYLLTLDDVHLVVIAAYGPWAFYIYLNFIMDAPPPATLTRHVCFSNAEISN